MNCDMNWDKTLSIITAITAICAIIISVLQISSSNKQSLFDRRINAFYILDGLVSICKDNIAFLAESDRPEMFHASRAEAFFMTNNEYLSEITEAFTKPLTEPLHGKYLKKRAELRKLAKEMDFIFKGKESKLYADLVLAFDYYLYRMYVYRAIYTKMEEEQKVNPQTWGELAKKYNEETPREQLAEAKQNLKSAYMAIIDRDAESRIKKQIRFSLIR